MVLWLLSHLSTGQLTLLLVGGPTAIAVAACLVIQRAVPNLHESDFERASEAMRGGFTVLFGLVLGLAIAGVSAQLAAARSAVSSEATTLAEMMRASRAMPPDDRAAINQALAEYIHAVVDDEWVTMRRGEQSPRAAAAFEALYDTYTAHPPADGTFAQSRFEAEMDRLDRLTEARRTRLQQAASGSSLPDLLRVLLSIGVIAFIAVWYPAKISDRRVQLVVVACTAAFISFAYLLTIVLDFPFSGDISVGTAPFREGALATFWPSG
jgi:hypothetical protein